MVPSVIDFILMLNSFFFTFVYLDTVNNNDCTDFNSSPGPEAFDHLELCNASLERCSRPVPSRSAGMFFAGETILAIRNAEGLELTLVSPF